MLQTSLPNIGPGTLKYRDVTPSATKMVSHNHVDRGVVLLQLPYGIVLTA